MLFLREPGQSMSLRQQIRYLVESTAKKTALENRRVTQDTIAELKDYIQDEEIRKKHTSLEKVEVRNKLIEEAQRLYKPIRKTIYLERKHAKMSFEEIMICNCKPPQEIQTGDYKGLLTIGCGKGCLNRIVSTECCASFCSAGDRCTNRRFQLQQHAQIYPVKTVDRGWGLAAGQPIRKGQFIIQYVGEVYSINSDLGRARQKRYRSNPCTYLMSICHYEVIDPTRKGNLARFINHSCDPNCETQKWNVMGEVCIGIFARRDIEEDEELTFDYRFDTHKTKFTRCYCGASNCRLYLGLVKMKEEEETSFEGLKCQICGEFREEDESGTVWCDSCNKGFHADCAQVSVGIDLWNCRKCKGSKKSVEEVEDEGQVRMDIGKYHFQMLKERLLEIPEFDVKIFWEDSYDKMSVSVYIRGTNAAAAQNYIQQTLENSVMVQEIEDQIICIEIKVQKILFHQAFRFCKNIEAPFNLEQKDTVSTDEIFPLNLTASFFLTGRSLTVYEVAEKVLDYVDHLMIFTVTVSQQEAQKIESDFMNLQNLVLPVEIRISKEKTICSTTHPFFSHCTEERKLVFIGTEELIQQTYRTLNARLFERFGSETETSYAFLLPAKVNNLLKRYKMEVLECMKKVYPEIVPRIQIEEPKLSKKYLTVCIFGCWKQIIKAKKGMIEEINRMAGYDDLDIFFSFAYNQIYRTVLKGVVKFVYEFESAAAASSNKHEKMKIEPKRITVFKFWDLYSAELTVLDSPTQPIDKFRAQVISHFIHDTEMLLYTLRLSSANTQIANTLRSTFKISTEEAIQKFVTYMDAFPKPDPKKKHFFNNKICKAVEEFLIDQENVLEMDLDRVLMRALDQVRISVNKKKFRVFPVSFGGDIDENDWEPEGKGKLGEYLEGLERREIILGSELKSTQIVSNTPVLFEAKEKADVMVGCFENTSNILYVMFDHSDLRDKNTVDNLQG